ncbi:MAG: PEP-CTERM sorting domain-containing protein [Verrucomicrobiota bacterium]
MKIILLLTVAMAALFAVARQPALALPITVSSSYVTALVIPDNNATGVAETENFGLAGYAITSLQLSLQISGGYNGDYYAYLRHGALGFAVLLNRPGLSGANPYGYPDSGFNVTLSDGAANGNIHSYQNVSNPQGGVLTGWWQPDGGLLSAFNGLDPSGAWTLSIADLSPVGIGTLTGWALTVTADTPSGPTAVPDGGLTLSLVFLGTGAVMLAAWLGKFQSPPVRIKTENRK